MAASANPGFRVAENKYILSNSERRSKYDAALSQGIQGDILENMDVIFEEEMTAKEKKIRDEANQEIKRIQLREDIFKWFYRLLVTPMLSGFLFGIIFFRDLGKALWLGLLGIITTASSIVGIIPCFGQYFLYLILNRHIIPWWFNASGLSKHWLISLTIGYSYLMSVGYSIFVIIILLAIFIGRSENKSTKEVFEELGHRSQVKHINNLSR